MPKLSDFDAFFKSKKNANCILKLEKSLLSDDNDCVLSSLDVFKDVITKIFQKGMLQASPNSAEEKFRLWLTNRYNDFVSHIVGYLVQENSTIQEKSLDTLMVLVSLEGDNSSKEGWFFPKDLFQKIVCALSSQDVEQKSLIDHFKKYTDHDDIKTYLLKSVLKLLEGKKEVTDVFLWNVYHLLDTFEYPKQFDAAPNSFLSREGFLLQKKLFCKLFSNVWTQFLKFTLPRTLLHNVLSDLPEKVLPHVSNPCLMTDFLTDAYNHGSEIGLLSLNGLYYLIDKHNVEYPDFFKKLYLLFDMLILRDDRSPMLLEMADHFLSSTHLPAYLVAAFAKKALRCVIVSSGDVILRILPFVYNLLIRNPALEDLIHRPTPHQCHRGNECYGPGIGYTTEDPFDIMARDPAESRALESSLWEIRAMQRHSYPEVVSKAKFILKEFANKEEFDLTPALNTTMPKIYKDERKRQVTEAPPAAEKPSKLKKWYRL